MIKFKEKNDFLPSTNSWQDVLSSTASQIKVSSSEEPTSSMMSCLYTPSLIVWYLPFGTISWFLLYHLTTALSRETWHSSKARCLYMAIFTLRGFKKWTGSSAMIILGKFKHNWRNFQCNAKSNAMFSFLPLTCSVAVEETLSAVNLISPASSGLTDL